MASSLFFRGLLAAFVWVSIGVVAMNALPSWADTIEWTDPNNGNFNDSNKWTVTSGVGLPPPAAGDLAEFNEAGTYTVTFTQNEASDQFNVRAGDVLFLSDSATLREYTIATGGADALVRDGGTLTIGSAINTNPVFVNVSDLMNIGTGTGDGAVTVSGSDSRLDVLGSGLSHVGLSGRIGNLTITDGATANYGTNGTFRIGVSGNAATLGTVLVDSSGTLNTGHVELSTAVPSADGTGQMTVDGSGSSINQTLASANLTIGAPSGTGTGTLNVDNGGVFTTGTGTTTINATGTLNAGVIGNGTFNANGNVNVDGGTINRGASSSDFNLATGLTLTATNDAQINFIGEYAIDLGTTIDIQSGADFTLNILDIGGGGGDGTLVVDGPGSSVTAVMFDSFWGFFGNTADVTFRNGATGNLGDIRLAEHTTGGTTGIFRVESGATVTTDSLRVAPSGGATTSGTITVDGGTSSLTQTGGSSVTLGHSSQGTATFNITGDGTFGSGTGAITVKATGTINIGNAATGGTFNANGNMTIDGAVNLIDGQMNAGMVTLNGGGAFNFTGGILSVDTFQGDLTQDGGTLVPGASPGTTIITNDYVMNAGTLAIELGGLTAGTDFDQLVVAGNVTLGGMLDVSLIPPFTPSLGQSFEIVDVGGSLTGTFSGLSQGVVVGNFGGTDLFINYAGGDGNDVTLLATLAGDFDFDFDVDGNDFLLWQRGGSPFPLSQSDLADWEANYGMVAPLSASSAAVPEPATFMMLLIGMLALQIRRDVVVS